MNARMQGYERGREYQRSHTLSSTTLQEWRTIGERLSCMQYRRVDTQQRFQLGWWHAAEQFLTLYKTDGQELWGMQRKVQYVQECLGDASERLSELLEALEEDSSLHVYLFDAHEAIGRAQNNLDLAQDYLREKGKTNA